MKKQVKRILLSAYIATMLGGCGSTTVPEFGDMSTRYTDVLEQYQINSIFYNIIRSANSRPLSFLDIPAINGSGTISIAPGASALFNGGTLAANAVGSNIAGGLASVTPSLGLSIGKSVNFSQVSLDNSVFWKGFLTTLPSEIVDYFMVNNIPKELLYSMVIEELRLQTPDGVVHAYVNDPLQESHLEFQQLLYKLMRDGLAPKKVISSTKIGGVISEASLRKLYGDKYRQLLSKDNLSLLQVGPEKERNFQMVSIETGIRYCLNKNSYANFAKDITRNDFCQTAPLNEDEVQDSSKKGTRLYLKTRSTAGIYGYLGNIMSAQLQPKPYLVTIPPISVGVNSVLVDSNKYAVLVVKENTKAERPFAYINDYLSGNSYLIPQKDDGYSKRTIQILSALQTLQKTPNSIPPSPSVLVR